MAKRTKDWQTKLLKKYRIPEEKTNTKKSVLTEKQLKIILKKD